MEQRKSLEEIPSLQNIKFIGIQRQHHGAQDEYYNPPRQTQHIFPAHGRHIFPLKVPANAFKNSKNENLTSAYELEFTVETKGDKVEASIIGFTDGENALETLEAFKSAQVRNVVYNYKNYSAENADATILIGYYDGNLLKNAEFFKGTGNLSSETAGEVTQALNAVIPEGTTVVKVFVWSNLVDMIPYCSSYELAMAE